MVPWGLCCVPLVLLLLKFMLLLLLLLLRVGAVLPWPQERIRRVSAVPYLI
jgi:hypothetical protein